MFVNPLPIKEQVKDPTPSFREGTLPRLYSKKEVREYNEKRPERTHIAKKKPMVSVSKVQTVKRQEQPVRVEKPTPQPKAVEKPVIVKPKPVPKPVEKPAPVPKPVQANYYEDTFVVTAYTNGPESTGKTSGDSSYGVTASGEKTASGRSLSCPPELSFGTVVELSGIGKRVCVDRGSHIVGKRFDLFISNLNEAINFGRKTLKVKIYK